MIMLASYHHPPQVMPKEAPQPDQEAPVIIHDQVYTYAQPTTDRAVLTQCIEDMAKKVKQAMDLYASRKDPQYARRLRIHNQVERNRTEEFVVPLPISESSWSDLSDEMIELYIVRTIMAQVEEDDHIWFRVRLLFDQFMDKDVKEYLDKLDSGEALFDIKQMIEQSISKRPPAESVKPAQVAKSTPTSKLADEPKPSTSTASTTPAPEIEPQVITISDDEEEDVILID